MPVMERLRQRSCSASRMLTCLCLALACTFTGVGAQLTTKLRSAPAKPITICVINSAPDLSLQDGVALIPDNTTLTPAQAQLSLQGLSLDMISAVFDQILGWPYQIRYHDGNTTSFSKVALKVRLNVDCDIAVQSFFVDSVRDLCTTTCLTPPANWSVMADADLENYVCCIDFSYPYYTGGWSFMSQVTTGSSNVDYLGTFFQRDIVQALSVCVICMFSMAHIIWLAERTQYGRATPQEKGFAPQYLNGLKDGVWFSTTTMLGGLISADKAINTPFGRLISTVWVFFAILMTAFITAVISASLTTAQLTTNAILTASDVAGKKMCTPAGFFAAYFDSAFPGVGVQKVLVDSLDQCFPMVSQGSVDAVFGVREESLGFFQSGQGAGLMISPVVKSQAYGMIWEEAWDYGSWANEGLLEWQRAHVATQPGYDDSIARWYYGDATQITYGGGTATGPLPWDWNLIAAAGALVGTYLLLQSCTAAILWYKQYTTWRKNRSSTDCKDGAPAASAASSPLCLDIHSFFGKNAAAGALVDGRFASPSHSTICAHHSPGAAAYRDSAVVRVRPSPSSSSIPQVGIAAEAMLQEMMRAQAEMMKDQAEMKQTLALLLAAQGPPGGSKAGLLPAPSSPALASKVWSPDD